MSVLALVLLAAPPAKVPVKTELQAVTGGVKVEVNKRPPNLFGLIVSRHLAEVLQAPKVAGRPGTAVTLRLVLDARGAVTAAKLERPSGNLGFDNAALMAAKAFGPKARKRLPVPTDPAIRKQALGEGVLVYLPERLPKPKAVPGIKIPKKAGELK